MIPLYFIVILDFIQKKIKTLSALSSRLKYFCTIYLIIEFFLIILRPSYIFIYERHGQYVNNYINSEKIEDYYHINRPEDFLENINQEFVFKRKQNSLGLSDKEWVKEKPEGTYRIICLGDSFTEGDGVDYEYSYVQALQKNLNKKYKNIEVLNAGKRGSDPFFNFKLLEDKLIEYQPDMVIQSFTANDYYFDFVLRGGMERFGEDSTLIAKRSYWWEPIYASSYIARILIQTLGGYDKYLIKTKEYDKIVEDMKPKTAALFRQYKQFSEKNHFDLIVFTIPFNSVFGGDDENEKFHQELSKEFSKFDLTFYNLEPCYDDYVKNHHAIYQDYYWKKDGHHNAKGYEMMAECIDNVIEPFLINRHQ
ncbi:MAG: SGNH/GDSL hydrolase family protein [Chitinophagales bacterium]|nr:SGNH/GDSL hydrolase family protein [Chitinophagales bacterium]